MAALLLIAALWIFPVLCWGQYSPTVIFTQPPPTQAYAGTTVVLAAMTTSGQTISFSVASGPAQVSGVNGSTLTFTGIGAVVVEADLAANGTYPQASVQAPPVTVSLLKERVTAQSASVSTIVTFTAPGKLYSITALTQGAMKLDFNLATTPDPTACNPGFTYTTGQTCLLEFTFKPTHPGIRYGGITLTDATGNLLGNSYIYGYGVGPQVLYEPILQTMVGNSLGQPNGVAINGNGDLFVSNSQGGSSGLVEIAANGTVTPIGNLPAGKDVAVDGSGNVFLITYDTLYEVMAVNGGIPASPVIQTLAQGFTVDSGGLAIDGSGNAYIANGPANSSLTSPAGVVYEVTAVNGVIPPNSSKQTLGQPFAQPTGVAVDSSSNVYVSDGSAPGVFEMTAVNGSIPASPALRSIGNGYVSPSNIRLDDTNDIFISDAGLPGILEFTAVNGVVPTSASPKYIGSGFSLPQGLLVDDSGDVFVADQNYPEVVKLNYSSVPKLNFASTPVGQTSTDSPQTVTYTNAGNADLIFTPPVTGNNPTITSSTSSFTLGAASTPSSCPQLVPGSSSATLAVGQSCSNQVSFTPLAAGPQTGTLTTVDNDLSVANTPVQLNGNGTLETPSIQFSVSDHYVDDPPFTVTATSTSPGAFTYSVQSGPATATGATVTLSGTTGVVTLLASQAISIPYDKGTATASFNVIKHSQTINFVAPATPVLPTASPVTLVATASSGLPVVFSVVSGPATVRGNQLAFTGFGLIVVAANQAGNAIYSAAPQVTQQIFVLDNRITMAISGTPNPVFLTNPVTFTATIASPDGAPTGSIRFLDGITLLATVPLNGTTASMTTSSLAAGTHPITAVYSGDAIFAPSTSAPFSELVEDFSLTISNPDVTISHGGTAVYNLTVTTVGGTATASEIQFAVAGNPDHSPLTFNPPQIAAGSATTNVTLTIQTPDYPVGPWAQNSSQRSTLALLSLGAFFGLGWRRRRSRSRLSRIATLLLALGMTAGAATLSGCGSWGAQPYSMTVTASSGTLSHSVSANLVSQ